MTKARRLQRSGRRDDGRWSVELPDFAQALAWSPDGALLAAATLAGPIVILDGATGEELGRHPGHPGGALCVAWSPDGETLVSGGQDGRLLVQRRGTTGGVRLPGGGHWVEHLAFSPDGESFAAAAGRVLRMWSRGLELEAEVSGYEHTITSLFWLPGSDQLVTSTHGGMQFVRARSHEWVQRLDWQGAVLRALPDAGGRWIAAGTQDGVVHVWNTETGQDLQMTGYRSKVRELAWTRGPLLATGGGPGITLWSFAGDGPVGKSPLMLDGHTARVSGLAFSPDGERLFSCAEDGALVIWQRAREAWTEEARLATERPLFGLSLSDDGARVAAAGAGGQVTAWPV